MKVSNQKDKYWRLLKLVLGMGLLSSLSGFVIFYFWDYGFSLQPLTIDLVLARAVSALGHGLLGGFYTGFPMWLAIETFKKPERSATKLTPSVPTRSDA